MVPYFPAKPNAVQLVVYKGENADLMAASVRLDLGDLIKKRYRVQTVQTVLVVVVVVMVMVVEVQRRVPCAASHPRRRTS